MRIPAALALGVFWLSAFTGGGLQAPCPHQADAGAPPAASAHDHGTHTDGTHADHAVRTDPGASHAATHAASHGASHGATHDTSHGDHGPASDCEGLCQIVCGIMGTGPASGLSAASIRSGDTALAGPQTQRARTPDAINPCPLWVHHPHALPLSQAPPEGTHVNRRLRLRLP